MDTTNSVPGDRLSALTCPPSCWAKAVMMRIPRTLGRLRIESCRQAGTLVAYGQHNMPVVRTSHANPNLSAGLSLVGILRGVGDEFCNNQRR